MNLLITTFCCHGLVLGLSYLVSWCGIEWWWLWFLYLWGSLAGWFIHLLGHQKSKNEYHLRWYAAHTLEHHVRLYPYKRFLNKIILGSNDPNEVYYRPILYVLGSTTLIFKGWFPMIVVCIVIVLIALVVSWFHDQYHLDGTVLEKYGWFLTLREIHRIHHRGQMQTNYGVIDPFWDYVFGTLVMPE